MSVSTELDALHTAAGIFPLSDSRNSAFVRAFLRITGPDATRWLNGMVTNNIKDLQPGEGNYNFLLNAQGRIMGDCTIYREPHDQESTFLFETDATQIDTLHQLLDKFIIMDDVELTKGLSIIDHPVTGMAVLGKKAPRLIHEFLSEINEQDEPAHFPIPKPGTITYAEIPKKLHLFFGSLTRPLVIVMTPPTSTLPQFNLWFEGDKDLQKERKWMESAGAIDLSDEAQEAYRILSGTPRYGTDIRNSDTAKDLPQETAQTHALHFAKGCYLGQEIVERIRSRGQVHRTFTRFTLTGEMPSLPAQLTANDKPAGDITSVVLIGDTIHALGYIRRELLETHAPITYPGGTATPSASR
jgi:folate-binding protein YgfZ